MPNNALFFGIRFPQETASGKPIKVRVFPMDKCFGTYSIEVTESTEYIKKDGMDAYPNSLAFIKEAPQGCVNFYTKTCHIGKPDFTICDDIADTTVINFSSFANVLSMNPDTSAIERIWLYTGPNFSGDRFTVKMKTYYNLQYEWRIREIFNANIRSVRLEKH